MNPPTICNYAADTWDKSRRSRLLDWNAIGPVCKEDNPRGSERVCAEAIPGVSQRYYIWHAPRLRAVMPLRVPHSLFNASFENVFGQGLYRATKGKGAVRLLGGPTFA